MIQEKQSTYLPAGVTEVELDKIQRLSRFIYECFTRSSRKDQLVEVVHKSIATDFWYPCLQDLDNWSDWDRFAALGLLLATVDYRHCVLDSPFLVLNFTQLRHWFHRSKAQLRQPRILPRSWGRFVTRSCILTSPKLQIQQKNDIVCTPYAPQSKERHSQVWIRSSICYTNSESSILTSPFFNRTISASFSSHWSRCFLLSMVCLCISGTFNRIQNEAENSIMTRACGMHLSRLVTWDF